MTSTQSDLARSLFLRSSRQRVAGNLIYRAGERRLYSYGAHFPLAHAPTAERNDPVLVALNVPSPSTGRQRSMIEKEARLCGVDALRVPSHLLAPFRTMSPLGYNSPIDSKDPAEHHRFNVEVMVKAALAEAHGALHLAKPHQVASRLGAAYLQSMELEVYCTHFGLEDPLRKANSPESLAEHAARLMPITPEARRQLDQLLAPPRPVPA